MSKGVEEVQRWPLHPQPQTGDALTSWLRRIGNLYGISNIVILHKMGDLDAVGDAAVAQSVFGAVSKRICSAAPIIRSGIAIP